MEDGHYVGKTYTTLRMIKVRLLDLITPVILGVFSAIVALFVMGFALIKQRTAHPRFETQDYYKTYKGRSDYFKTGNPFKNKQNVQGRSDQRLMIAVVVGGAVLAMIIAAVFDFFGGLLIIFMLPVIIRFIQTRKEASSRRNTQGESRPTY